MSKLKRVFMLFKALLLIYFLYKSSNFVFEHLKTFINRVYYLHIVNEFDLNVEWFSKQSDFNYCDNKFQGFGHEWALLKNVTFIPGNFFTFQVTCPTGNIPLQYPFKQLFREKNHLNIWWNKLQFSTAKRNMAILKNNTTVAVMRYEYANIYHQFTDYYNAFILMKYLRVEPDNFNIFLIDIHPESSLDKNWDILFGNVLTLHEVSKPIAFRQLVWNVLGYNSPLNFHSLHSLPYVEDFSRFIKSRFGIQQERKLDCSKVSVLFILRRDYIAHPRNPSGKITRKIFNEKELLQAVESEFPGHNVTGTQLDKDTMEDQIKMVSQTDILVGMHGAGLTHVLELPQHAGVLELFPMYWGKGNHHFKAMAKWRGLNYLSWQNINPTNEQEGEYTYVPPPVVTQRVKALYYDMCRKTL